MGTLDRYDLIVDFQRGDKIDLRKLHVTFLGSYSEDEVLSSGVSGKFYFNATVGQLRFDVNGDGIVDHVIGVTAALLTATDFFLQ
jgi:hypothetical protein